MLGRFVKEKKTLYIALAMLAALVLILWGINDLHVHGQAVDDAKTQEENEITNIDENPASDVDTKTSATPTEKRFKYVRVGYYYSDMFQEGMTDQDPKSGYGYEYMQKIADYNGWEYLYVYGDLDTLTNKLENGFIDVLCGVSMDAERKDTILFPNYEMGKDRYVIYQREEDKIMDTSDMSTFNRTTIGAIKNTRMTEFLEAWIRQNKLDMTIKYYDDVASRDADFRDKKTDGIISTDNTVASESGFSPVVTVGEEPCYMAVTKSRPDLLRELNNALSTIQELEPYFMQSLQSDNYGTTVTNSRLTEIENAWLSNHSEIRVGYTNNYLPYCGTDENGQATGLMTDVFEAMIHQLNLSGRLNVTYQPYASYQEMVDALNKDEVDAIFPAGGGVWNMEQDGIDSTSAVVTAGMNLVYSGSYSEDKFQKIAVSKGNRILYYYVTSYYPESEILYCDSVEDCLNKVLSGEASSTIINGLRSEIVRQNEKYDDLSLLQLEKTDNRCIGVMDGNYALLLLLNRGVRIIGRDYGINASYNYVDMLYARSSLDIIKDNIRQHILATIAVIVFLMTLIAFCVGNYIMKNRERKWFKDQAYTDGLTKLNNRLSYEEEISKLDHDGIPEHFVYESIDINGLKQINDSLGHAAGDELIIGAAHILREVYGKHAKIYRTGGDEYIVMFKATDVELEKYNQKIDEVANNWKGELCSDIHLAVGCVKRADYPDSNIHELAKIADDEMYINKDAYYEANGLPRR